MHVYVSTLKFRLTILFELSVNVDSTCAQTHFSATQTSDNTGGSTKRVITMYHSSLFRLVKGNIICICAYSNTDRDKILYYGRNYNRLNCLSLYKIA
jgi:hypothetical protein